jgi:hypothetical protein
MSRVVNSCRTGCGRQGGQRVLAEGHGRSNCQTLFGMAAIPTDAYIRQMLDGAPAASFDTEAFRWRHGVFPLVPRRQHRGAGPPTGPAAGVHRASGRGCETGLRTQRRETLAHAAWSGGGPPPGGLSRRRSVRLPAHSRRRAAAGDRKFVQARNLKHQRQGAAIWKNIELDAFGIAGPCRARFHVFTRLPWVGGPSTFGILVPGR